MDFDLSDDKYYYNYTGKGVYVHVLDTGINIHHEEFEGRAKCVFVASGLEEDCMDNLDCNGHGI